MEPPVGTATAVSRWGCAAMIPCRPSPRTFLREMAADRHQLHAAPAPLMRGEGFTVGGAHPSSSEAPGHSWKSCMEKVIASFLLIQGLIGSHSGWGIELFSAQPSAVPRV